MGEVRRTSEQHSQREIGNCKNKMKPKSDSEEDEDDDEDDKEISQDAGKSFASSERDRR